MYLIIVGAGAVSRQLISLATEQGHRVAVIEKRAERAREIMQQFDVQIFHADIAQGNVLEETDIKNADAVIATTKDDSVNLMTMLLGKEYQVKHLNHIYFETRSFSSSVSRCFLTQRRSLRERELALI
ncbi:MAG: NAD-binding protein [Cyanobacteria bacterium J06635_13]